VVDGADFAGEPPLADLEHGFFRLAHHPADRERAVMGAAGYFACRKQQAADGLIFDDAAVCLGVKRGGHAVHQLGEVARPAGFRSLASW